jgi:hypothetical protein
VKEISLDSDTTLFAQELKLVRSFHAFRDHFEPQAMRHGDQRAGNLLSPESAGMSRMKDRSILIVSIGKD